MINTVEGFKAIAKKVMGEQFDLVTKPRVGNDPIQLQKDTKY